MIRLHGLSLKQPSGRAALSDVNLHVKPGELVALTGPSGCGRSTLFRVLFGAQAPDSGAAVVGGRNLARLGSGELSDLRRRIGVVMEEHPLIKRMSVLDNVALAGEVRGYPRSQAVAMAAASLNRLGLGDCSALLPQDLCAAERRAVNLARALVPEPDLLLADEPTAGMDPDCALKVLDRLQQSADSGTTVVFACNDIELLGSIRGRVLILNDGHLYEDAFKRKACA